MTIQIKQAREAYWSAFPDGKDLPKLEEEYCNALARKAEFYHEMTQGAGLMGNDEALKMWQYLHEKTGSVDGGYHQAVEDSFQAWTRSVGAAPNPADHEGPGGLDALIDALDEWHAFCFAEMRHEYLTYAPTSPLKSDKPLERFDAIAAEHAGNGINTVSEGRALREKLTPILGESVLAVAADLSAKSETWSTLQMSLTAAAQASDDDRVFGLYLLLEPGGDASTEWTKAKAEWDRLLAIGGEEKLRATITPMRKARVGQKSGLRTLYRAFKTSRPNAQANQSAVYPLFDFADLGGAAWAHLVAVNDQHLVGLRLNPAQPADAKAPQSMEIVDLDVSTGKTRVVATATPEMVGAANHTKVSPKPASLIVQGDWVYATESATGAAFRVHIDGSGFAAFNIPHGPGEVPLLRTVDSKGNVLATTLHTVVALDAGAAHAKTLLNDSVNSLDIGTVGPDGAIYVHKWLKAGEMGQPSSFVVKVDPAGAVTTWPGEVSPNGTPLPFKTVMNVLSDGRLLVMNYSGDMCVFDGKSWVEGPRGWHFIRSLVGSLVPVGDRLYGVTYSEDDPTHHAGPASIGSFRPVGEDVDDRMAKHTVSADFTPSTGLIAWTEDRLLGVSSAGGKDNRGFIYVVDTALDHRR